MKPEDRAYAALLKCIEKRPWLENYQPVIAEAIREAEQEAVEPYIQAIRIYIMGLDAKYPGAIMWDLEQKLREFAELPLMTERPA